MKKITHPAVSVRRAALGGGVFAILFALAQCIRTLVPPWPFGQEPSAAWKAWTVLFLLIGAGLTGWLLFVLCRLQSRQSKTRQKSLCLQEPSDQQRRFYWGRVLLLLAGWMPVFLAYYPGIFAYDVAGQIPMNLGSFTNWHPLAHTMLLKLFYDGIGQNLLGSHTAGVAVGTLVQMAVFAMQLALPLAVLHRMRCTRWLQIVWLLFFMTAPFVSVMAVSLTKDVLFAGFFVCVLSQICLIVLDPDWIANRWHQAQFVLCLAGLVLFRNTGLYILIGFSAVALIVWVNHDRARAALLLAAGTGLGWLINFSLIEATAAYRVPYNDPYAAPIQQIASVWMDEKETMPLPLRAEIEYLIPDAESFFPYSSDPIRPTSRLVALEKSAYLRVYLQLLWRYPVRMISSFLLLNQAYWYLPDSSMIHIYHAPHGMEGFGYYQLQTIPGLDVEPHPLLPSVRALYEHLFQYPDYAYLSIPILGQLCSPALYVWIFLFCMMGALVCRQSRALLPLWLCLMLAGTLFLGPCALLRYALPLMISAPLLFQMIFGNALKGRRIKRRHSLPV